MKKVLMVVFQFPPFAGSSAVQRTLRFVQHLPANGWSPIVLTVNPMAYEQRSDDLLKEIPSDVPVHRAFGLDTRQHLAIAGRYPAFLARPDRWVSWMIGAVPKALRIVRQERPQALWSTYPIASAHLVAGWVHRLTGLPWIADFRDPMAQEGYPADPATWRAFHRIESTAVAQAAYTVFTTPGAAREYSRRYPDCAHKIGVIENGYDEHSFTGLPTRSDPLNPGMVTLLHSGVVYPSERDPTQLFEALGDLNRTAPELARRLRLRFRASSHDGLLHELARRNGVGRDDARRGVAGAAGFELQRPDSGQDLRIPALRPPRGRPDRSQGRHGPGAGLGGIEVRGTARPGHPDPRPAHRTAARRR
jgi:hypothetical protein